MYEDTAVSFSQPDQNYTDDPLDQVLQSGTRWLPKRSSVGRRGASTPLGVSRH